MMRELDVKEILAESEHLPTMPTVAQQLLSLSEWEDADLGALADIISKDISLTSKILRTVNSPFYGIANKVSTLSQALVVLGLRATRSLVLSFSLVGMSPGNKKSRFDYPAFWTRSLNTAVAARELALLTGLRTEEEAFLAGLLQDIGMMVIGQCVPHAYQPILAEASRDTVALVELERERLGIDHVEVAKLLFEKWNLPSSLCAPVLYHHSPAEARSGDDETLLSIRIQNFAGRIGEWLYASDSEKSSLEELHDIASRHLNISPKEFEALLYRVDARMEEMAGLFDLTASRPNTYADLLEKAQLTLGDIVSEQERLLRELEAAKAESQRLAEQLRQANRRLLDEARKDPLTGLANRRSFEEFLHRELNRSLRHDRPVSLLFIDLDGLKSVNDSYGHLEGSNVLTRCANILSGGVRASDLVARFGGDEFMVALVETRASEAKTAAERIRRSLEETTFPLGNGQGTVRLTASIGVAVWEPRRGSIGVATLVEEADSAMYTAKKAGKNRVSLFDPGCR